MSPNLLRLKIQALLHEAPEKAVVQQQGEKVYHDLADQNIRHLLGTSAEPGAVRTGNRVASGADRYNFPGNLTSFGFLDAPILRHPLSGAVINLSEEFRQGGMTLPDAGEVQQAARRALSRIQEQYGVTQGDAAPNDADSLRRLYLALWRLLPAWIQKEADGNPGASWALLPADVRLPDHSSYGHATLTSALAGAGVAEGGEESEGSAALLLFTIGPVQEFISAARKTADLWAGSYLISYLMWQAIRVVCNKYGPDAVLFPDLYGQPLADLWLRREQGLSEVPEPLHLNAATFPNRFFAVVPASEATTLATTAQGAVQREFVRIGRYACEKLDLFTSEAKAQLKQFLECYWTVLPFRRFYKNGAQQKSGAFSKAFKQAYEGLFDWDDGDADRIFDAFERGQHRINAGAAYGRLYKSIEALLGSRKALRGFGSFDEPGYRCSLLPGLAALVPGNDASPKKVRQFWEKAGRHRRKSKLTSGERLSAVALAKRFFSDYLEDPKEGKNIKVDAGFPSTSSIAVADFKADVLEALQEGCAPGLREKLEAWLGADDQTKGTLRAAASGRPITLDEAPLPKLRAQVPEGDDLLGCFARLGGDWLFAETYDAERINRDFDLGYEEEASEEASEGMRHLDELMREPAQRLRTFLQAAAEAELAAPSKYYAVLAFDGDHMGRWLSGQKAPHFHEVLHPRTEHELRQGIDAENHAGWEPLLDGVRRPLAPLHHRAISRALGTFALGHVRRIMEEEHLGRLVYSGGDDVLAFVSFRDALGAARRLRAAFSGHLDADGRTDWTETDGYIATKEAPGITMGCDATASAGVVFAHHRQALRTVLNQARAAEKYAKDEVRRDEGAPGRNALAICAMKRSGETFTAGTKWTSRLPDDPEDPPADLVETIERYADLVRAGLVSTRLVYVLESELDGLAAFPEPGAEAIHAEARRLFFRHAEGLSAREGRPEEDALPDWLREAEAQGGEALKETAFRHTLGLVLEHNPLPRAVRLLDVAQFIGQGGDR